MQRQKHQPIFEMTKEVQQQRLEDYVLHDDEHAQTFFVVGVADDETVEVQFPHETQSSLKVIMFYYVNVKVYYNPYLYPRHAPSLT